MDVIILIQASFPQSTLSVQFENKNKVHSLVIQSTVSSLLLEQCICHIRI